MHAAGTNSIVKTGLVLALDLGAMEDQTAKIGRTNKTAEN